MCPATVSRSTPSSRVLTGILPTDCAASEWNGIPRGRRREAISRTFVPAARDREEIILHARQKHVLTEVLEALRRAAESLEAGEPDEVCAEEVKTALSLFSRLTGEVRTQEVIEDIFRRFCVGK